MRTLFYSDIHLFLDGWIDYSRESADLSAHTRPHTLGAEELYKAHLTPYLQEAQSTLNNKLEATHKQNAELAQRVQAQRREIEELLSCVESVVTDIEGAATAAAQFSRDSQIRQIAAQMDEEVNARPAR